MKLLALHQSLPKEILGYFQVILEKEPKQSEARNGEMVRDENMGEKIINAPGNQQLANGCYFHKVDLTLDLKGNHQRSEPVYK